MPYNNPYNRSIAEQIDNINKRYVMYDNQTGMGLSGGGLDTGYETPRSLDRVIGGALEEEMPRNVMEGTTLVNTMAMPSSSMSGMGLSGGRTPKGVVPPHLKGWLAHVASVKSSNPTMKYKDVLALAKQSYSGKKVAPIVKEGGKLKGVAEYKKAEGVKEGEGLSGGAKKGKGLSGGRTPKGVVPPHLKGWLAHVASVKSSNPTMKYKDVLALAKQSYKK
jgi:hypothetical protein